MENKRIFGVVAKTTKDKKTGEPAHARIRVLALLNADSSIHSVDTSYFLDQFPPEGYVFVPDLIRNGDYNERNSVLIEKWTESSLQNQASGVGKKDKINAHVSDVRHFGYLLIPGEIESLRTHTVSFTLPELTCFYLSCNGYIYGPLLYDKSNTAIRPKTGKTVNVWPYSEKYVVKDLSGEEYVLAGPEGLSNPIRQEDAMSKEQLLEWFRVELKAVFPEFIKTIDAKIPGWMDKLAVGISNTGPAAQTRLKRMQHLIDDLRLDSDIVEKLMQKEDFKELFLNFLKENKEQYMSAGKKELEKALALERATKQKELESLDHNIATATKELKVLANKKNLLEDLGKHFTDSRQRLLNDFIAINSVLNSNTSSEHTCKKDYVIEHLSDAGANIEIPRDFLENRVQPALAKYGFTSEYGITLLDTVAKNKITMVPDIRLAKAFVDACGEATYILREIPPNWLGFRQFWEGGLSEIWELTESAPTKLHFLLLEDFNMSLPDCWGRPIWDLISGVREKIPFAKSHSWPKNLRLLVAKAPQGEEDTEDIGLPISKCLINNWGIVERITDTTVANKGNLTPGHITIEFFENIQKQISM